MTIDTSQLASISWVIAAGLVLVVVFLVVRFLWRHVVVFVLRIGLFLLGIVAILAVLRYFKVF